MIIKSKYFKITELVCPHVFAKFGERAWMFIDSGLIEVLDILKEKVFLDKKIIINNWNVGGSYSQRGLRCNMCSIVKGKSSVYLSAHIVGKGIDFNVEGLSAPETRREIERNKILLPYPIRLENDQSAPTWVHLDVYPVDSNNEITYFRG